MRRTGFRCAQRTAVHRDTARLAPIVRQCRGCGFRASYHSGRCYFDCPPHKPRARPGCSDLSHPTVGHPPSFLLSPGRLPLRTSRPLARVELTQLPGDTSNNPRTNKAAVGLIACAGWRCARCPAATPDPLPGVAVRPNRPSSISLPQRLMAAVPLRPRCRAHRGVRQRRHRCGPSSRCTCSSPSR